MLFVCQIPDVRAHKPCSDYRGLKKRITAIRLAQSNEGSTPLLPASPVVDNRDVHTETQTDAQEHMPTLTPRVSLEGAHPPLRVEEVANGVDNFALDEEPVAEASTSVPLRTLSNLTGRITESPESISIPGQARTQSEDQPRRNSSDSHGDPHRRLQAHFPDVVTLHSDPRVDESISRTATLNMGFLPRLRRKSTMRSFWEPSRRSIRGLQWDLAKSIPLRDLLPNLTDIQRSFFQKLDMELDKVETFYVEREKEMRAR